MNPFLGVSKEVVIDTVANRGHQRRVGQRRVPLSGREPPAQWLSVLELLDRIRRRTDADDLGNSA